MLRGQPIVGFMPGSHVRFASSGRVTPFVHALAGANHARVKLNFPTSNLKFKDSQTNSGLKVGGGLDIGMSSHTALRLGFDYRPVFERDNN
jgi:opacity protein-like surface antigen